MGDQTPLVQRVWVSCAAWMLCTVWEDQYVPAMWCDFCDDSESFTLAQWRKAAW